jgi:hypothetical protein
MRYIPRSHPNGVLEHGDTDVDGALGLAGRRSRSRSKRRPWLTSSSRRDRVEAHALSGNARRWGSFARLSLEAWASVGLVQNAIWPD